MAFVLIKEILSSKEKMNHTCIIIYQCIEYFLYRLVVLEYTLRVSSLHLKGKWSNNWNMVTGPCLLLENRTMSPWEVLSETITVCDKKIIVRENEHIWAWGFSKVECKNKDSSIPKLIYNIQTPCINNAGLACPRQSEK